MCKFIRLVGYAWASPLTLFGFICVVIFSIFGWCSFVGDANNALVWVVTYKKAPQWLMRSLSKCHCKVFGNVVLLNYAQHEPTMLHVQTHIHQNMVFGVFQPIIYWLSWCVLCLCKNVHPHYDNPLEIDARRSAGQIIDATGILQRIELLRKTK